MFKEGHDDLTTNSPTSVILTVKVSTVSFLMRRHGSAKANLKLVQNLAPSSGACQGSSSPDSTSGEKAAAPRVACARNGVCKLLYCWQGATLMCANYTGSP